MRKRVIIKYRINYSIFAFDISESQVQAHLIIGVISLRHLSNIVMQNLLFINYISEFMYKAMRKPAPAFMLSRIFKFTLNNNNLKFALNRNS